jgi:hypothetical protein
MADGMTSTHRYSGADIVHGKYDSHLAFMAGVEVVGILLAFE